MCLSRCGIARLLALARCARLGSLVAHRAGVVGVWLDEPEIDPAPVQIDPADLHIQARTQGIADAGAFAAQLLAQFVVAEVVAAQLGDVHQPFDVEVFERDEQAKAGDGADHAAEHLA